MKYVSVDEMADALMEMRDQVSVFDSEAFRQIIHTLRTDIKIGVELPDCDKCKHSLRDYRGIPKVCVHERKITCDRTKPMSICVYFEEEKE